MIRCELIGDTLDHVLSGYNIIKSSCYGKITIEDKRGHKTSKKTAGNPNIPSMGIYLIFDDNVKVCCDTPYLDLVSQINHIIKRERFMVKATDPTLYKL